VLLAHRRGCEDIPACPPKLAQAGATLAKPKSRILAWSRLVTKMLAGLMSR
jgi:hypothetical protein